MTASSTATARRIVPGSAPTRPPTRPKLKVLDQRAVRQRSRRRHALLAMFIVVLLGFFAVAFVHAELVAGQQDLDAMRTKIAEVGASNAKLARAVERASSPESIVNGGLERGMVRAHEPVYLVAVAPVRDLPQAAVLRPQTTTPSITTQSDLAAPTTVGTPVPVGLPADAIGQVLTRQSTQTSTGTEEPAVVEAEVTARPSTTADSGVGGTTLSVSGATVSTVPTAAQPTAQLALGATTDGGLNASSGGTSIAGATVSVAGTTAASSGQVAGATAGSSGGSVSGSSGG